MTSEQWESYIRSLARKTEFTCFMRELNQVVNLPPKYRHKPVVEKIWREENVTT